MHAGLAVAVFAVCCFELVPLLLRAVEDVAFRTAVIEGLELGLGCCAFLHSLSDQLALVDPMRVTEFDFLFVR